MHLHILKSYVHFCISKQRCASFLQTIVFPWKNKYFRKLKYCIQAVWTWYFRFYDYFGGCFWYYFILFYFKLNCITALPSCLIFLLDWCLTFPWFQTHAALGLCQINWCFFFQIDPGVILPYFQSQCDDLMYLFGFLFIHSVWEFNLKLITTGKWECCDRFTSNKRNEKLKREKMLMWIVIGCVNT